MSAGAAGPAPDLSILGLVQQAGPVVQGVMGALALASVASRAVMIEKSILLARLKREVRLLKEAAAGVAALGAGLAARIQRAAAREWAEGREAGETRGEYRERIERAMRETLAGAMREAQAGLALLATTGAVGPFVGLFGTVWGIMGSFQGIAQSHDTSLAVVAPRHRGGAAAPADCRPAGGSGGGHADGRPSRPRRGGGRHPEGRPRACRGAGRTAALLSPGAGRGA